MLSPYYFVGLLTPALKNLYSDFELAALGLTDCVLKDDLREILNSP